MSDIRIILQHFVAVSVILIATVALRFAIRFMASQGLADDPILKLVTAVLNWCDVVVVVLFSVSVAAVLIVRLWSQVSGGVSHE